MSVVTCKVALHAYGLLAFLAIHVVFLTMGATGLVLGQSCLLQHFDQGFVDREVLTSGHWARLAAGETFHCSLFESALDTALAKGVPAVQNKWNIRMRRFGETRSASRTS